MLILPGQLKVFATLTPTDMRKSFDGLIGVVEKQLGQHIEQGHLFLFFNRRRDRLKVLFFTGDGAVILYKRLERGTFEPLVREENSADEKGASAYLTLSVDQLRLLLEGIELSSVKRRKWWHAQSDSQMSSLCSKPS